MKTYIKKILAIGFLASPLCQAAVLQDFSSTLGPNTYFYGTWAASGGTDGELTPKASFVQGSGVYSITGSGVTDSSSSFVEFFYSPRISIGSDTSLSVTAQTLSGNLASSFQVILLDNLGRTATATFLTSSFSTGATVVSSLTFQNSFNSSLIDSFRITGGQSGGSAEFKMLFDSISTGSAIPEASTFAAIAGASVLGLVMVRRRSRA